MRYRTFMMINVNVLCVVLFLSCSGQKGEVEIVQYTDPTYIVDIAKYRGAVYCATEGGLVKWDTNSKEYQIYTTADGLPSNVLTCVIADNDDRLWIGSHEGVGMFNGTSWETFGIAQGLPSPDITDFAIDKSGQLWVGTKDGAASYNRGRFHLLAVEGSPGRKQIDCLYFDKGGNFWIGTNNEGIYYFMNEEWIYSGIAHGTTGAHVIAQSWDLSIWSATWNGISLWDGIGWKTYPTTEQMQSIDARYMASTKERLWFFTSNGIHSARGPDWTHIREEDGLISNNITAGLLESDTKMYAGSPEGLSIIDGDTIENFSIPNKPVGSNFISLAVDDRGRTWLGTWETGITLYDSGIWTVLSGENPETLSTVRSIVFHSDNTIVFNTLDGIVFYNDREWKRYTRNSGISANDVRCGLFDTKGRYWAGTATGICYLENGRWKRYRSMQGLPSEDTWACGLDSQGTVWFGTTEGIVSFEDGEMNVVTSEIGLDVIDVRSILVQDDVIYFGTNDGKLIMYDGGAWDVYGKNYLKTEQAIYSITSEPGGALWIGTFGDGVIRIEEGKAVKYDMSDGLPSDYVRSVAFHDGILWAACYGGVGTVELKTQEK